LEQELVPAEHISTEVDAARNLRGTCGTMLLPEFTGADELMQTQADELVEYLRSTTNGGRELDKARGAKR
jgi:hypothetical protein